ncbi:MAG: hypothetical protein MRJ93_14065 [Nitrososphaeraceae archaeon]|nr:hypothetical protein [Nitrososphaeraceae archaeon]
MESLSIELFNPVYYAEEKILQFDITPDDTIDIDLLNESDQTTLAVSAGPRTTLSNFQQYEQNRNRIIKYIFKSITENLFIKLSKNQCVRRELNPPCSRVLLHAI